MKEAVFYDAKRKTKLQLIATKVTDTEELEVVEL